MGGKVSWTDCTLTLSVANGCLTMTTSRTAGKRDMLELCKGLDASPSGIKALRLRYKADAGKTRPRPPTS